jgi:hypothetical protein
MKRLFCTFLTLVAVFFAAGASGKAAQPPFGVVDYIEGSASISRDGKTSLALDLGASLSPGDLLATQADGLVVISLDKSTGMKGNITVRSNTALYLKLETVKGDKRTTLDLLAGSVASKVKKLAGHPSMRVTTNSAVAGVRGTEFEVSTSIGDAILVICSDGAVSCSDGSDTLPVQAGKALEKRPGEKLAYLPVSTSSIQQFRENWIAGQIDAFRADPIKALADYEKRYADLSSRFQTGFEPFQKSAILKKWMDEERQGIQPRILDPTVMREKREIASDLLALRKILFTYERIYYRMLEVEALVADTPLEKEELRPGYTAGEFIRRVRTEREGLARRVALFRFAEKLYAQRSDPDSALYGDDGIFDTGYAD